MDIAQALMCLVSFSSPNTGVVATAPCFSAAIEHKVLSEKQKIDLDFHRQIAMMNYHSSYEVMKPLLNLDEDRFFSLLPSLMTTYFTPESLTTFVAKMDV